MTTQEQMIALENGSLAPAEQARCEREIAADPEALQIWIAQRQMNAMLRVAFDGQRGRLVRSIMAVVSGTPRDRAKNRVLRAVRPVYWPMAAMFCALAVAVLALVPLLRRWDVFMPGIVRPPVAEKNSALGLSTQEGKRRAFMWPFSAHSMWNLALRAKTGYAPVSSPGFDPHTPLREVIVGRPVFDEVVDMPVHRLLIHGEPALKVRFADRWGPGFAAAWPVIVIIDPARREVIELRGADRLASGDLVAQEFQLGQLDGAGDAGLAESGVSALGGLIRYGELERGIPHALAVSVPKGALRGNLKLGTRLAIPASVDIANLGMGDSGPGFELARALQDYGAFITDTGSEPFAFLAWYENVPPGLAKQVATLLPHLQIVTKSEGELRRPEAPPFEP